MIIHVQQVVGIAGAEHYLMALLPALLDADIEVGFIGLVPERNYGSNEPFFSYLEERGVKTRQIEVGRFPSPSAALDVSKVANELGGKTLHSYLLFSDVVAVQARLFNLVLQVVSTKHGFREKHIEQNGLSPNVARNWYWALAKATEAFIKRSFAVSGGLKDLYVGSGLSNSMDVIHHGVLPKVHEVVERVSRKDYRIGSVQLIVPGRLVPYKGQRFAIEAFNLISKSFPDAHMVIAGDGPSRPELERLVRELGLCDSVTFLGWRRDVIHWMEHSDLAIIPSIGEGFGLVFLEAYQAGIPVVGFDVAAANEIVENGVSGILVHLGDSVGMANAAIKILSDERTKVDMTESGQRILGERFSFERVVNETIEFYVRAGVLPIDASDRNGDVSQY